VDRSQATATATATATAWFSQQRPLPSTALPFAVSRNQIQQESIYRPPGTPAASRPLLPIIALQPLIAPVPDFHFRLLHCGIRIILDSFCTITSECRPSPTNQVNAGVRMLMRNHLLHISQARCTLYGL
jgi:hypothetical protein